MKTLALSTILVLLAVLTSTAFVLAQAQPEFNLGFKALADQIPDVAGMPLESEHWGANGDSLQRTSTGLMAWRKADNWTAFTNGATTWINGPAGVQSRPNAERFDWEALPTVELSGKGASVTQKFDLQEGIKIVHATHNGQRNFIVEMLDASGTRVDYLTNEIGSYDGRQAMGVSKAGQYLLNVQADGAWSISIEQPRPTSGEDPPQTFTGKGKAVTPFISLTPGMMVVTMQHQGSRNFIVQLMDKNGRTTEYLANQIGNFNGEKAIGVSDNSIMGPKPGLYLLSVNADGNWSITLEYR